MSSRVPGRSVCALAVVLSVIVLAGCEFALTLEFEVDNQSAERVRVKVVGADGLARVREDVPPRTGFGTVVERPADWVILLNGQPVADSTRWPEDNPTITIVVQVDGSIEVRS